MDKMMEDKMMEDNQIAYTLDLMFEYSLSLLIFQQVYLRITSSYIMQSTTLDRITSQSVFYSSKLDTNFLRMSFFFISIISTENYKKFLNSSRSCIMIFLSSTSSPSTIAMKFCIKGSSFLSSNSLRRDSKMLFSYLSTFLMIEQEIAKAYLCSKLIRLIASDIISIHFWWFFIKRSFLKFYLNGLLALYVLLSSLLYCRGLQINWEFDSFWAGLIEGCSTGAVTPLALVVQENVKDFLRTLFGVLSLIETLQRSPLRTSQEKTSDHSALIFGSLVIILLINLTTQGDALGQLGILISSSSMIIINWAILLLWNGQNPQIILNSTTPSDHMSDLMEQFYPLSIQGAMQIGDPSIVFEISSSFSSGLQNPKSASLMIPSWRRRLSGLRSRCMMLCLLRTRNASRICPKQVRAVFSGNFPFYLSRLQRFPPLQYSQTKQKLLTVLSISQYLMMWGEGSRVVRMLIQLQVPSSNLGNCLNFSALTILMATSCLVLMLMALKTVEQLPRPISFCNEQFSIIFPIFFNNNNQIIAQTYKTNYEHTYPPQFILFRAICMENGLVYAVVINLVPS